MTAGCELLVTLSDLSPCHPPRSVRDETAHPLRTCAASALSSDIAGSGVIAAFGSILPRFIDNWASNTDRTYNKQQNDSITAR